MGLFKRKPKILPSIQPALSPRGKPVDYFVLRGLSNRQAPIKAAARKLKLKLPKDGSTSFPVRVTLKRGLVSVGSGVCVHVEVAGILIGYAPSEETRRLLGVLEKMGTEAAEADGLFYKGQSGGWNAKVLA